jgi:hypothetical protein
MFLQASAMSAAPTPSWSLSPEAEADAGSRDGRCWPRRRRWPPLARCFLINTPWTGMEPANPDASVGCGHPEIRIPALRPRLYNHEMSDRGISADEVNIRCIPLGRPFSFSSPFPGAEFVMLLVVCDSSTTTEEHAALSQQIVEEGCRYAVCTGHNCELWHDLIDESFIGSDPNFNPPNDRMLMTTWHENEPIEEVVEFFRWNTSFANFTARNFLIVFLGDDPKSEAEVLRAVASEFGGSTGTAT